MSNYRSRIPKGTWRKVAIVGGLLAAVTTLLASQWLVATPSSERPTATPGTRDNESIRSEIAQLRRQVDRMRKVQIWKASREAMAASKPTANENAETPPDGPDSASSSETGAHDSLDPEMEEQKSLEAMQAQVQVLDETWRGEEPDPQWASQATAALNEAYSAEELAGIDAQADCRWSLCRVDLTFTSSDVTGHALTLLSLWTPWKGRGFIHMDTKDNRGVFYVARENFELPRAMPPDSG